MENLTSGARRSAPGGWGLAIIFALAGLAGASCTTGESSSAPTATPAPSAPAATQSSGVTKETKSPLKDQAAAAAAGKPLYAANCASCHGDAGKGDGPIAENIAVKPSDLTKGEVPTRSDGEIFLVVRNGKMRDGKMAMPPVKKLTDEQIWQVVAYVRTLAKK
jgi:mono/diheme cytochrome c family protein